VFGLFLSALDFSTATKHVPTVTLAAVMALRQRMNLARRFFRLFRFVETFHAAQKLYGGMAANAPLDAWLDVFARTFNGMYLLLDAPAIVSELKIDGLQLWSPETDRAVMVEAQRFWLFALACGAMSSFLKMQRLRREAYKPKKTEKTEKTDKADKTVAAARTKQIYRHARGVAANSLDIVLPGVIVGWIDADPGTVGLAMLVTTLLTGMDAWERAATPS
jgi:hypothetical protein